METIILQEKDEAILDVLTIALELEGFKVCALRDCDESLLNLIDEHKPHAVVLNYEFEDTTCIQMRQRIKKRHSHLPVIVMSCNNNIKEEYGKHGFDNYIKKPFDLDVLFKVLKKPLPKLKKSRGSSEPAY